MGDWVWDHWEAIMVMAYGICGLVVCWAAWPRTNAKSRERGA
jgi:hypothetical protein